MTAAADISALQLLREQVRAEVREAHAALKDLNAARKGLADLIDRAHGLVPELVGQEIEVTVESAIEVMRERLEETFKVESGHIVRMLDQIQDLTSGRHMALDRTKAPSAEEIANAVDVIRSIRHTDANPSGPDLAPASLPPGLARPTGKPQRARERRR
jgi:hypothetical protein